MANKPKNGDGHTKDNLKNVDTRKKFTDGGGLRFNEGKLRYDLVHPKALEDMVKVLTFGAEKYKSRNWERGMDWTKVIASLKRHIAAWEQGEDYDKETGLFHMAHAASNVHFLNAYYYLYPQGDDRPKRFINQPNIGLDIDEVLAGWMDAWCKKFNIDKTPESWIFDSLVFERFDALIEDNTLEDFYMNLEPLIKPSDIPFEPHCYITARPIDSSITMKWLEKHGFPAKKVINVSPRSSKADVAKENGVEIFIDDNYENFVDMNRNGVTTYLYSRKHNERFDVGHLRIKSLKDLPIL